MIRTALAREHRLHVSRTDTLPDIMQHGSHHTFCTSRLMQCACADPIMSEEHRNKLGR